MALLLTGSLWLQVVGIGLIPYSATTLPVADCTKKSQVRQISTNPQHRGSIWRWYGSLWRIADTMYCKMILQSSP